MSYFGTFQFTSDPELKQTSHESVVTKCVGRKSPAAAEKMVQVCARGKSWTNVTALS